MKPTASYSPEPDNPIRYTRAMDLAYTWFAGFYDVIVKTLPLWRRWIEHVLPHIQGPNVLEVSSGTGYLLTQYASKFKTCGLDYNRSLIKTAQRNLAGCGLVIPLTQATVEALPYPHND